jgi:nucleotide-binding universal stress UspA family protein
MRDVAWTERPQNARPRPGRGEPARGARRDAADRALFGIDFGPASLGAARWAVEHVGPRDGGLLAHVVPWPDGTDALDVAVDGERTLRAMRPALMGGLTGFAASLRLERTRSVVRVGRPSAWLAALAAAEEARLIVLGRRRDAARHRIGEPNVIERVARRAACDVLVVPEGTQARVENVIAAVDAGPAAASVVAAALALARARDASLTLVHVLSPWHGSYDRLVRPRAARADEAADEAADAAPAGETAYRDAAYAWLAWLARDAGPPIACDLAVPTGDAGREIAALAARRGASVVVLGKRGADEAPPGSLGSVARELLARCPLPVLAVEGGAGAPAPGGAE